MTEPSTSAVAIVVTVDWATLRCRTLRSLLQIYHHLVVDQRPWLLQLCLDCTLWVTHNKTKAMYLCITSLMHTCTHTTVNVHFPHKPELAGVTVQSNMWTTSRLMPNIWSKTRDVVLETAVSVSRALETNFMWSWSWSWEARSWSWSWSWYLWSWSWSQSWRVGLEKFQGQLCMSLCN